MNWILCPVKNRLDLTRRAVRTFLAQDIGNTRVLLINNNSTDGTGEWARTLWPDVHTVWTPGWSVAASWNAGLDWLFGQEEYVLVVNNDVELRKDTYRWLVEDGGGFVTAVGVQDRERIQAPTVDLFDQFSPDPKNKRPHPDFSCFLIRREVWETVGPFDEKFKRAYAEDWDYHCRLHRAGIEACCIDLPFYHVAAGTVKGVDEAEADRIHKQAEENRRYFQKKWGFAGASEEYYEFFKSSDV